MRNRKGTEQKLFLSTVIAVLLACSLCITTYALYDAAVTLDNNRFNTGNVHINLNDRKPVINEKDLLFEPGMTVEKTFFIENQSTWAVYYKIYFENVEGGLADVIHITILDREKLLYEGTAADLTRQNVTAADDILLIDEKRELTILFHYPEESGNASQNSCLQFDLCAEAVQEKNNPDREFE